MPKREKHRRSVAKAVSWRITATITTMILVYFFTGSFALSLGLGAVELVVKLALYYRGYRKIVDYYYV